MRRLPEREWRALSEAHAVAVDDLTSGHRERRARGAKHPVEDFLFEYYGHSPAKLRRWHPGPGVVLAAAADSPHAGWRWYRQERDEVALDVPGFMTSRERTVRFVRDLLAATLSRPGHHGCFGLHEWAMVYQLAPGEQRHEQLPLRLGQAGTDAVVEAHQVRCSHHDAYRFFTPAAVDRNALRPTRESQVEMEQPACLHAGMDVYKWAFKLAPAVPSEITLDAFRLAREIRELDMRASPYDVSGLGLEPLPVELPAGKAEYVARQRDVLRHSNDLRRRLVSVCDTLLAETAPPLT